MPPPRLTKGQKRRLAKQAKRERARTKPSTTFMPLSSGGECMWARSETRGEMTQRLLLEASPTDVAWAFGHCGMLDGWFFSGGWEFVPMGDDAAFAAWLGRQPAETRDDVLAYLRDDDFIWYMQGALCAGTRPGDFGYFDTDEFQDHVEDVLEGRRDDTPSAPALIERFAERVAAVAKARQAGVVL